MHVCKKKMNDKKCVFPTQRPVKHTTRTHFDALGGPMNLAVDRHEQGHGHFGHGIGRIRRNTCHCHVEGFGRLGIDTVKSGTTHGNHANPKQRQGLQDIGVGIVTGGDENRNRSVSQEKQRERKASFTPPQQPCTYLTNKQTASYPAANVAVCSERRSVVNFISMYSSFWCSWLNRSTAGSNPSVVQVVAS